MSLNLAATPAAAVQIPFLNWQYIYCWIVSWFGRHCTETGEVVLNTPSVSDITSAATTTLDAAGQAGSSFWSWLWPFHSGASGAANAATQSEIHFWASLAAAVPAPIKAVFAAIGWGLGLLWSIFSFISFTVSGLLFLALLGACMMLVFIRIKEWGDYGTLPPRTVGHTPSWSRWQDLLDATMATEPKRWKDGIIAADQMLGELLTRLGYYGESTAVQLRSVPEGAFITLPQAWEAHRIRNFVVQRSSNFILTQREAFRVMKLYEQVFEEFDFI